LGPDVGLDTTDGLTNGWPNAAAARPLDDGWWFVPNATNVPTVASNGGPNSEDPGRSKAERGEVE